MLDRLNFDPDVIIDPYITYLIELTNYFNNWNFMQQSWQ